MDKRKILLAVGHRQLEEYLEKELNNDFDFVGPTVHREGITKLISQSGADVVIIRETLEGSVNIMSVIYQIRSDYPKVRIIFLAGNRKPGDDLLATLVNYGVYDILYGANIPANSIIEAVKKPNSHSNVAHLQPVPTLDEKRNKVMFESLELEDEEENEEYENTNDDGDDVASKETNRQPKIDNKKKKSTKKPNRENPISKFAQGIKMPQMPQIPTMSTMKEKNNVEKISSNSSKNRIITFIGGKNGVGTSSIGINIAFEIAQTGKKVIYLEINEHYPAISYWYEIGLISQGIDSAIESIEDENYAGVTDAIIRSTTLKKTDSPLKSSYKKFPDTLDFMFFSKEYIIGLKPKMDLKLSKELYMHLLYQEGYDYVFIDVQPDISNKATMNGLIFSNLVFSIITQDVSSIGYHLFHLNELEKKGLFLNSKNSYIINRYVNSDIGIKDIKEWVENDQIITFPSEAKDFIDANLKGLPVGIYSSNPDIKNSIVKIINKILEE